jgi:predicted RNA-binding Zn-ribbon protein involved in translation (DUF1610 family)
MTGRYGVDDLSKFTLGLTLVFVVLSFLFGGWLFFLLGVAGLVLTYYRMLSRDFAKRSEENAKFLSMTEGIRKKLRIMKKRFDGRKDYRFFKCPDCGQEVRVPKGRGRIRITCPKCKAQFDRTA